MALNAISEILPPVPEHASPPPEFSKLPPEITRPASAFASPAEGITPPADEFEPRDTGFVPGKKRSLMQTLKKVAYGAVAAVLILSAAGEDSGLPIDPDDPSYWEQGFYLLTVDNTWVEGNTAGFTYRMSGESEMVFPMEVTYYAVDGNGKRIDYEPDVVEEPEVPVTREVDISGLDRDTERVVWLEAHFQRRGHSHSSYVDIVVIAPGSDELIFFEDPEIFINKAVLERSLGKSVVKYSITIDRHDAGIPIPVRISVVDVFNIQKYDPNTYYWGSTGIPIEGEFDVSDLAVLSGLRLVVEADFERSGTSSMVTEFKEVEDAGISEPDEPAVYPLEGGTVVVTVYNNTFDMAAANDPTFPYQKVLMHTEFNARDFSGVILPEAYDVNDDFDPAGYVLHIGSPFDIGFDAEAANEAASENSKGLISLNSGYAVPINGEMLTREDVEKVRPTEDGTRYVNVHVVWKSTSDSSPKLPLELDYGDHIETVEADTPYASEGFFYLCVLDQPLVSGKTLTGWKDSDGNLYDFVSYYDFFPLLANAQSNEDRDWQNPVPIRLTAVWRNWN